MFQSFSPNMLKTFEICPKKFQMKYVKKISMPVNDDIFETGKNIHALASYYLRKENIYKLELALNDKEKEIWDYLKNIKYFAYETVKTEYNLSAKVGGVFFGGRLDALVKDDEHYYILDYKTGSAPKNATYDFQTMIYMLCVSLFYKTENITFVYIDLKNREEFEINLTKELILEYKNKLQNISEKINKSEYLCNKDTKLCNCEYKIICY